MRTCHRQTLQRGCQDTPEPSDAHRFLPNRSPQIQSCLLHNAPSGISALHQPLCEGEWELYTEHLHEFICGAGLNVDI